MPLKYEVYPRTYVFSMFLQRFDSSGVGVGNRLDVGFFWRKFGSGSYQIANADFGEVKCLWQKINVRNGAD